MGQGGDLRRYYLNFKRGWQGLKFHMKFSTHLHGSTTSRLMDLSLLLLKGLAHPLSLETSLKCVNMSHLN